MKKLTVLALFVGMLTPLLVAETTKTRRMESTSKTLPAVQGGPVVKIRLPERFRVLTDQLFDLRVEASNLTDLNAANIKIILDDKDITSQLGTPEVTTDNDNDPSTLDKA